MDPKITDTWQETPPPRGIMRKMSAFPRQPRVFAQKTPLVVVGVVILVIATVFFLDAIREDDPRGLLFVFLIILLIALGGVFFILYGLTRSWGVDEDKIWSKFGNIYYREVRFDQMDRYAYTIQGQALYQGGSKVTFDYWRFDWALVNLRVLEELSRRRFKLDFTNPDSPKWEKKAMAWRRRLYRGLMRDHGDYYRAHPEEFEYLAELVRSPLPALTQA